jgi:hypothetical protein
VVERSEHHRDNAKKQDFASRRGARKTRQTCLASLRDAIIVASFIPVMALR